MVEFKLVISDRATSYARTVGDPQSAGFLGKRIGETIGGELIGLAGYTFTTPPAGNPFGSLGRDAFRSPGFWQLDTGIDKSFLIHERIRLQFRSEFFNILNKTNFSPPTATTTSAAFGTIRSTFAPRQIQFALKLLF